jgi:hypothetical protein
MWGSGYGERAAASVGTRIAWAVALTLALPVQAALAPMTAIGSTVPDIPLLVVLAFSLCHGAALSMAAGAAVGTGLDIFAAGSGPFHAGAYAALAFVASSVGRITAMVRTVTVVALVAVASLALGVGHLVWGAPVEHADDLVDALTTRLAPQALYDTVLAWLLFAAWRWRHPPSRDTLRERDEFFSAGRLQRLIR